MALIVLDTSAIVAILQGEPEAQVLRVSLTTYGRRCISDVNAFELQVVLFRRLGVGGSTTAQQFLHGFAVERLPFDQHVADEAFAAYRKYGKGSGHAAQLNMSDCAAYATARVMGAPLLFKGDDFSQTDVLQPTV